MLGPSTNRGGNKICLGTAGTPRSLRCNCAATQSTAASATCDR